MPRSGGNADVRWFETDACYVFHPMNAYEEDGQVVLDVSRYERLLFMDPQAARDPSWQGPQGARLHRWRLDLKTGTIGSTPLDDLDGEFPRVDERLLGRKHRFGYLAATGPQGNDGGLPEWTAVRKYDLERGTTVTRSFGPGNGAGEPLFVPRRENADEDDGCVLALVYDRARNASDFYILDARDVAGEPIATIRIPHRIPYGFHGNWVPAA
jgi:carotenoid cleavage dioxygenase